MNLQVGNATDRFRDYLSLLMKSRQHKFWLTLSIVAVLLLWQIVLIIVTLKENLTSINFNLCNIDLNQTNSSIPRIIHQMWKTNKLSTYPINNSHSEWKRLYPDYTIRLWTDEDLNELISDTTYRYLYYTYKSYPYSIQRADLGRLIVLHSEGGIYADLDVFPCSRQVEKLRLSNVSFIIPRAAMGSSLINHFLAAQKSSPIIDDILHEVVPLKFYRRIYIIPYLQVFSTGSIFLTRFLREYIEASECNKRSLWILSDDEVKKYVIHHVGRSWHSFDGYIFNQIYEYQKLFIFFLTFCIIFLVFVFKHQSFTLTFIKFR
ncbi:unnamed protein product [Rotaria socialis]|uniref:Uncharacterized protein n=2 Tax=Rotaria socialis TaxID=392032 RepID=A0A817QT82_9BILA|nr:unnamed protein product [Rotaria socialis]